MLKVSYISGPLVFATMDLQAEDKPQLLETVLVGDRKLLGEIIGIDGSKIKIQVYEDTTGLRIGEEVELQGELLSVEVGPGLLGQIFDGIQRPLAKVEELSPIFIKQGLRIPSLDYQKQWEFIPIVQVGEKIVPGQKIGYVQETATLKHWILVPPVDYLKKHCLQKESVDSLNSDGELNLKLKYIQAGYFTVLDKIGELEDENGRVYTLKMAHKVPVKIPRPYKAKLKPNKIFKTGQRVIDALFPIMLGGKVVTPGPFGSGKSFTQQQIAKWSDAEIVIFIGCGERGNELTDMLKSFPKILDPRTNRPLMERTILIANTSNMPIAAREASIYTGVSLGEYYRDMGYQVIVMADSTSRWAEALREISQRLGEMPSEEGYPAYISSAISEFYERAGVVQTYSDEEGSLTLIGTVSPPGGDFSEPITQNSLKNAQVFLALDANLAARRHYPAINWQTSYSLYNDLVDQILSKTPLAKNSLGEIPTTNPYTQFVQDKKQAVRILSEENRLLEIIKILGVEGLSEEQKWLLEIAKILREDFLQQNGFDPVDTYSSFDKTMLMLRVIIAVYEQGSEMLNKDESLTVSKLFSPQMKKILSYLKYQSSLEKIKEMKQEVLDLLKDQNQKQET